MPRLPLRPLLYLVSFFAFVVLLDAFNRSQSFKLSSLRSTSEGSLRWLPSYGSKAAPSFIPPKPKAAFVILARNFDLPELLPPLASLEQSFNAHPLNNYPYIFLNNHPWQDEFKDKLTSYLNAHRRRVGGPSPAPLEIYFQQIAVEDWEPKNGTINWDKAKIRWGEYKKMGIPYATSKSYRHMCRFQSFQIFQQPRVRDLDYYWRVEPNTKFACNLVPANGGKPTSWDENADGHGDFFDPFRWMKQHNKTYGWVLSLKEYKTTIRSLWPNTRAWMLKHPEYTAKRGSVLPFVWAKDKIGYNFCHFWSNFEIAKVSFFQSEAYTEWFKFIDSTGMFYYQRTGDAPVHTLAAAWLLEAEDIHQFKNLGYYHTPFNYCPRGPQYKDTCACDENTSFLYDITQYGCQAEWDKVIGVNSTEEILKINAKHPGFEAQTNWTVLNVPGVRINDE